MRTVLAGILVCVFGLAAASAQSLGEIAKKTEEAKSKTRAAAEKACEKNPRGPECKGSLPRTYTNADLNDDSTRASAAPPDASKSAPDTKPFDGKSKSTAGGKTQTSGAVAKKNEAPDHAVDLNGHDEAYWRARLAPLAAKLADDIHSANLVRTNLEKTQAAIDSAPDNPYVLQTFGPEAVKLANELRTWNHLVIDDQAAIDALEEEGRRAGALPGWFR